MKYINRKYELFIGKGENLNDDRIYIRELLKNFTKQDNIIIKKAIVFLPLGNLAEGGELVDITGFGDIDLLRKKSFETIVKNSNMLLICVEKSLKVREDYLEIIRSSGIIDKVLYFFLFS